AAPQRHADADAGPPDVAGQRARPGRAQGGAHGIDGRGLIASPHARRCMSASVFEGFLSTPEMLEVFSEAAIVQAMMDFEAALAHAQADEGVIPAVAAAAIAGVCKAELYDVPALVGASGRAGSLAIPLVQKLTETVALFDAEAAAYVHWGSTSQDVIDTAMVLAMRRAMALIDRDLRSLIASLLALAAQHEEAPLLARTLLQPAQVVSFGFKLLAWVAPLVRS